MVAIVGAKGGQFFQPLPYIVVEAAFVVVDDDPGGDVHGRDQHKAFANAAFLHGLFYLSGDVDQFSALAGVKGEVLGVELHGLPPVIALNSGRHQKIQLIIPQNGQVVK